MQDQLKTLRDFFKLPIPHSPQDLGEHITEQRKAIAALTQLEAMVGEQKPVAWRVHPFDYGIGHEGVYATTHLTQQRDAWLRKGWNVESLYTAAPVAQQYEAGDMASAAAQGFRDGVASVTQQQDPVAWAMPKGDGTFIDVITPAEHARDEGSYTVPLFAHPVAQQPQAEPRQSDIFCGVDFADGVLAVSVLRRRPDDVAELLHSEQIELPVSAAPQQAEAVPSDHAKWCAYVAGMIGCYLGEADDSAKVKAIAGIIERRIWASAHQPLKIAAWRGVHVEGDYLYYDEFPEELTDEQRRQLHLKPLYEGAAPQQTEAVQACGHSMSLLLCSAESNAPLYCEACDDKSGRHDAERRETELLDANRRLQEKIASADALKLHAIEELCQLGYTVKGGELFPPDHLHKLMEAAGHPLAAPQQTEAVPPDVVRDAERYRYLRSHCLCAGHGSITVFLDDRHGTGNRAKPLHLEEIDEAIDAAIAQQKD